jgi:NADH-quinone oxidoreductase subunit N
VTAFFYVRIIVLMFFAEPAENAPRVLKPGILTGTTVGLGVAATLLLGILPGPVLEHVIPQPAAETSEAVAAEHTAADSLFAR